MSKAGSCSPKVAIVVYKDGLGPIFDSVYLKPAVALRERGWDVQLAVVLTAGQGIKPRSKRLWRQKAAGIDQALPGGLTARAGGGVGQPLIGLEAWRLRRALSSWATSPESPVVFHGGGTLATLVALKMKSGFEAAKVVHHCWGPEAAEYLHSQDLDSRESTDIDARVRNERQKRAFQTADRSVVLNPGMREWARQEFAAPDDSMVAFPCFVDTDTFRPSAESRAEVEGECGLEGKFVVGYVGSVLGWQLPAGVFNVLKAIQRIKPEVHFLAVTQHGASLKRLLEQHSIDPSHYTVVTASHDAVPKYINRFDLAILGRGLLGPASIVNQLASPVKYAEYLACGVPVLMGDSVGEFSERTLQEGVGLVLSERDDWEAKLAGFLSSEAFRSGSMARRALNLARERLSLAAHVGRLEAMYCEVASA